jgi:hypothetical protein
MRRGVKFGRLKLAQDVAELRPGLLAFPLNDSFYQKCHHTERSVRFNTPQQPGKVLVESA